MKDKIIIVLCMTFLFGCALQRDVVYLDDRLEQAEQRYTNAEQKNRELESKLNEYRKARAENDKDLRSQTAGQYAMLDSLREEIQTLSGKLEETEYSLRQQVKALDELSEKSPAIDCQRRAVKQDLALNISESVIPVYPELTSRNIGIIGRIYNGNSPLGL